MPSLAETTAALARLREQFAGGHAPVGPTRLVEVAGFGANPGGLRMLVHRPARRRPRPALVVVLHGCTQTAEAYAQGAGWLDLADRLGFVVLCPEQSSANNPARCFNWFNAADTARGCGEAASIRAMIESVIRAEDIDRARVFVTGLSAGGAMASALLAAYPEVFAGGGIVAGLPYGAAEGMGAAVTAMHRPREQSAATLGERVRAASRHPGPWPRVSIWHGEADHTVAPANAEAVARQWADVHGAVIVPAAAGAGRRRTVWAAGGRPVVELNLIAGLGHGAPVTTRGDAACGAPGPFLLEAGVSSTLEIARFWGLEAQASARPRPAEPPPREGPPPRGPRGVEAVIRKALKAAGLIRDAA